MTKEFSGRVSIARVSIAKVSIARVSTARVSIARVSSVAIPLLYTLIRLLSFRLLLSPIVVRRHSKFFIT